MSQTLYVVEVIHPIANGFFVQINNDKQFEVKPREYAKLMTLPYAKLLLERLNDKKIRARIVDQRGNAVTEFSDASLPQEEPLSLRTNHVTSVYRDVFNGRYLELPLTFNRSLATYYLRLRTSPHPADPPDVSISGVTPEEVFQKLTQDAHFRPYLGQFVVDMSLLQPEPAAAAIPAGTPMVTIPANTTFAGWRPAR